MSDDEDVSHGIGQDAKSGGTIDGFKFTGAMWKLETAHHISHRKTMHLIRSINICQMCHLKACRQMFTKNTS